MGILAQDLPHSFDLNEEFANFSSYIGAAYVKYIESAGARVVPVLIDQVSEFDYSFLPFFHSGDVSLLTVPLTGYHKEKVVDCLFLETTIRTALS